MIQIDSVVWLSKMTQEGFLHSHGMLVNDYFPVCITLVCFICTSVYSVCQCVLSAPVCTICTSMYYLHQCVLSAPVCTMYPGVYFLHQCVLCTPVSTMCTSVYYLPQCLLSAPVWLSAPSVYYVPQCVCTMCPSVYYLIVNDRQSQDIRNKPTIWPLTFIWQLPKLWHTDMSVFNTVKSDTLEFLFSKTENAKLPKTLTLPVKSYILLFSIRKYQSEMTFMSKFPDGHYTTRGSSLTLRQLQICIYYQLVKP